MDGYFEELSLIFHEHVEQVLQQVLIEMIKDVKNNVFQLQSLKYICFRMIK